MKNSKKVKKILLGNEAIVQGALEAGVEFVSAYPGTPSSEIGVIFNKIAEERGIYFEFSTNEKVALEAVVGASFSGLKCLAVMKNFGLNVASDALLPFCYTGSKGPTVIIVADDPSCWSSAQSEENSRAFAYLAHIPVLEPSDAQEAKDFVKLGFEISEKFNIPVIVRTTTRVAHQRMPVVINSNAHPAKCGTMPQKRGRFIKDVKKFVTMPPRVLEMKKELLEKIEKIREIAEKTNRDPGLCQLTETRVSVKPAKMGIITAGVSYLYVMEVLSQLKLDLPVLKLDFFYPLAEKKIKNFIKGLKKVLVVEELEPYLENEVKKLAKEVNCQLEVLGKNVLAEIGELNTEKVGLAVAKLTGKKYGVRPGPDPGLAKRFPRLCPGCPYWLLFSALKKAAPKETIFGGDIGCYMLAGFPPHNLQDYLSCMGSSIGIGHGIKKATSQKLIALIGDSTFFHAGIPALINAVFNKSNPLIIVADNMTTAMTGHQPNPGQEIKIENIVRACGVKNLKVIDPINFKELENTIKEFLEKKDVSVIISRHICALLEKKIKKQNEKNI